MIDFQEFPKMARLSRECIITEKIDGTNAQIAIVNGEGLDQLALGRVAIALNPERGLAMLAGSRTQWITPERDNHGFARWVQTNAEALWALGEGRHYGEWWGSGIQRGYGLQKGEKRFSLFNTSRWSDVPPDGKSPRPACCHVVPVISRASDFSCVDYGPILLDLELEGSKAAPGFMKPEGIVVYHVAGNVGFKKTIGDDGHKKAVK